MSRHISGIHKLTTKQWEERVLSSRTCNCFYVDNEILVKNQSHNEFIHEDQIIKYNHISVRNLPSKFL